MDAKSVPQADQAAYIYAIEVANDTLGTAIEEVPQAVTRCSTPFGDPLTDDTATVTESSFTKMDRIQHGVTHAQQEMAIHSFPDVMHNFLTNKIPAVSHT